MNVKKIGGVLMASDDDKLSFICSYIIMRISFVCEYPHCPQDSFILWTRLDVPCLILCKSSHFLIHYFYPMFSIRAF